MRWSFFQSKVDTNYIVELRNASACVHLSGESFLVGRQIGVYGMTRSQRLSSPRLRQDRYLPSNVRGIVPSVPTSSNALPGGNSTAHVDTGAPVHTGTVQGDAHSVDTPLLSDDTLLSTPTTAVGVDTAPPPIIATVPTGVSSDNAGNNSGGSETSITWFGDDIDTFSDDEVKSMYITVEEGFLTASPYVLWALMNTNGPRRMTFEDFESVRMVVHTALGITPKRRKIGIIPHYDTLTRSIVRQVLCKLAVPASVLELPIRDS